MSEVGRDELENIERDPGGPDGDGRPVEERTREEFKPAEDEDIPDEETIESVGY